MKNNTELQKCLGGHFFPKKTLEWKKNSNKINTSVIKAIHSSFHLFFGVENANLFAEYRPTFILY